MVTRAKVDTFRCALRAAGTAAAVAPCAAAASTWTVDEDQADCPNARFTSIQAAVDQAAPCDTVVICPGRYEEQSFPANHANTPAQAGSRNGLTITKPLTLKGAGADKVTIRPAGALAPTLAGTAPYLRDGGGNVTTVSRRSLGSADDNENFVDIAGVTIESPAAEGGVAFFNTSGRTANSVTAPIAGASDGVIETNSLQGAEAGVRRWSDIVAGLFDDARGADGAATITVRSGVTQHGNIAGSRITGPVTYAYGRRGTITGSEITGPITLIDAETGSDPSNPAVWAFSVTGSSLTGLTNSGAGIAPATGDDWGCCASTSGPVEVEPRLATAPAPLNVPGTTVDATPTATILEPFGPTSVPYGETIFPVVAASDDFGVKSVTLTADGAPVATLAGAASFGTFAPGVAQTYTASTAATVLSTAGDAPLSVTDTTSVAPGRLVNDTFALAAPVQARARNAANTGTAFGTVSDAPLNLLTWAGPISNDAVTLECAQSLGAGDALRTGTYAKDLTLSLATTTP